MSTKERLTIFINKLGSVLIDRRFWAGASVVILSLLGVFGVGEETLARIRELAGDDGAAIALLMETLVPWIISLLVAMKVIDSWTERPPSGTSYREVIPTRPEIDVDMVDSVVRSEVSRVVRERLDNKNL
jgi:hypothetical protein